PFAHVRISLAAVPVIKANDCAVRNGAELEEPADRVDGRLIKVPVEMDEGEFLARRKLDYRVGEPPFVHDHALGSNDLRATIEELILAEEPARPRRPDARSHLIARLVDLRGRLRQTDEAVEQVQLLFGPSRFGGKHGARDRAS